MKSLKGKRYNVTRFFMLKNKWEDLLKKSPAPSGWKFRTGEDGRPFLFTSEGLGLSLNFSSKKNLNRKQPLVKALGYKGKPLFVLDLTAGWAQEAFLISRLGCFVTAVESHPLVFYFVQESLGQKGLKPSSLKLILDDSLNYLNKMRGNFPDVVYMDPMFGGRKKALSQKSLRVLKALTGETKHKQALFDLALKRAGQRVVVKRHRLEPPLKKNRLCFFKGRSVCYDVFRPEKGSF